MTFLEYLLSFSESEYNNKPGKLTIVGLSIWIAIWRKFPANCVREKREKAALRFVDLPPPEMPWMFQEVQTWYFPLWHLPTPPLCVHGCSGRSPPSSSHAWDMPIWGDKSNNHSMGLVFKSACNPVVWMEDIMGQSCTCIAWFFPLLNKCAFHWCDSVSPFVCGTMEAGEVGAPSGEAGVVQPRIGCQHWCLQAVGS